MRLPSLHALVAIVLGIATFSCTSAVFGWSSTQHGPLANMVMNDPTIAPFISYFGLNQSSIASAAFEPSPADKYQWNCWTNAYNSGRNHNGYMLDPNFTALSETNRVGYMLHNCADNGVPVSHAPANEVFTDQTVFGAENELEIWNIQSLPSSMPTLYTGTYSQKLAQFHADQIDLATRYKAHHSSSDYGWAAQEGYRNCLRIAQAVMYDYFSLKMPEVVHAHSAYSVNPNGTLNLDCSGSYDPDGDTFTSISWDLNNDGVYDVFGANPSLSYNDLLNVYHLQPDTTYTLKLKVVDDDRATAGVYSEGFDTATLKIGKVPEPTALSLVFMGLLCGFFRGLATRKAA